MSSILVISQVDFFYFQTFSIFYVTCRRMLLGRGGDMCYLNKLLLVSVLGWLFQVGFFLPGQLKDPNGLV